MKKIKFLRFSAVFLLIFLLGNNNLGADEKSSSKMSRQIDLWYKQASEFYQHGEYTQAKDILNKIVKTLAADPPTVIWRRSNNIQPPQENFYTMLKDTEEQIGYQKARRKQMEEQQLELKKKIAEEERLAKEAARKKQEKELQAKKEEELRQRAQEKARLEKEREDVQKKRELELARLAKEKEAKAKQLAEEKANKEKQAKLEAEKKAQEKQKAEELRAQKFSEEKAKKEAARKAQEKERVKLEAERKTKEAQRKVQQEKELQAKKEEELRQRAQEKARLEKEREDVQKKRELELARLAKEKEAKAKQLAEEKANKEKQAKLEAEKKAQEKQKAEELRVQKLAEEKAKKEQARKAQEEAQIKLKAEQEKSRQEKEAQLKLEKERLSQEKARLEKERQGVQKKRELELARLAKDKEARAKQLDEERAKKEQARKAQEEAQVKLKAEQEKSRQEKEAQLREEKAKREKEKQAKSEETNKQAAERKAALEKQKQEKEAQLKLEKERLSQEKEAKAKQLAQEKAEKEKQEKIAQEARAKQLAEEKAKKEAVQKAQEEEQARLKAEREKQKQEKEAQLKLEKERLSQEKEAKAKQLAEERAKKEEEVRLEQEAKRQRDLVLKQSQLQARQEKEAQLREEKARKEEEVRLEQEARARERQAQLARQQEELQAKLRESLKSVAQEKAITEAMLNKQRQDKAKIEKIEHLWQRARQLYGQERYEDAIRDFQEIIKLEGNPRIKYTPEARKYIEEAKNKIVDKERTVFSKGIDLIEKDMINEVIKQQTPPYIEPPLRIEEASEGPLIEPPLIRKKLKKEITLDFDKVGLESVLTFLSEETGVNFVASQKVLDTGLKVTVRFQQTPVDEVIKYVTKNLGLIYRIDKEIIWIAHPEEIAAEQLETKIYYLYKGGGLFTEFSPVTAGSTETGLGGSSAQITKISTIEDTLKEMVPWPADSKLVYDKRINALIIRNTPQNLQMLEDILYTLDVAPYQVLIEARFLEVDITDVKELGVEWNLPSSSGDLQLKDRNGVFKAGIGSGSGVDFTAFSRASEGLNLTYKGMLTNSQFQAVLHALESSTKLKTLSSPRITTLNNQMASIKVVDEWIYPTRYEYEVVQSDINGDGDFSDAGETTYKNVPKDFLRRDVGILLKVIPSVGADKKTINLSLIPEVSEATADAFVYTGGVSLPKFTSRNLSTTVVANSGDTVVLGGLIKESRTKTTVKVPFLGDIPLFGGFFKKNTDSISRKNLLIFVTAKVLSPSGEEVVVAQK